MNFELIKESGIERLPMWEMYGGPLWANTRWIVYGLAALVVAVFIYGIWQRVKAYRMGCKSEGALAPLGARINELVRYAFAQLKVLREQYPGIFHLFLFWGFVVLFIGTAITVLDEDIWRLLTGHKFIVNSVYVFVSFMLDLFGVLAVIGLGMAIFRRYVLKPKGLDNQREDATLLVWIFVILVTGYLTEAARISVVAQVKGPQSISYEAAGFLGYILYPAFKGEIWHKLLWSFHVLISLAFVASIPYTKGLHIFSTMASIFTHSLKPKGKIIEPIPDMMARMEAGEEVELGYKRIEQFTWREILQLDACTRCGRCQDQCPAFNTGKHLSPKEFIQATKQYWLTKWAAQRDANVELSAPPAEGAAAAPAADKNLLLKSEVAFVGDETAKGFVDSAVLWDCTNCMACMNACPVMIEHVPLITAMRRELAMEFDDTESACKSFFKNMDTNANPWGWNPGDRAKWAVEMGLPTVLDNPDYEYLLFIGCMGAFDPKAIKANKAFVKIMQAAGVNFAVLGEMEMCCGDSIRRLGNEASFQALVGMFKQTVQDCGLDPTFAGKKLVTTCPHGYNCLKHEYPDFGFKWQVVHHTELMAQILKSGKLKLKGGNGHTAVLHDSCFLSRYNDVADEPRACLAAAGLKVVETERNRDRTFCCGGGGGRVWLEEHLDEAQGIFRINNVRSDEIIKTNADFIVTACPLCGMMFDEAFKRPTMEKAMEGKKVVDVAELLADALVEEKTN